MELRQFIETALLDIMEGVRGAQEKCRGNGVINPPVVGGTGKGTSKTVVEVRFDIEVGEISEGETSGRLGVSLAMLAAYTKGRSRDTERATNRLAFTVPVLLPEPNCQSGDIKDKLTRTGFDVIA